MKRIDEAYLTTMVAMNRITEAEKTNDFSYATNIVMSH